MKKKLMLLPRVCKPSSYYRNGESRTHADTQSLREVCFAFFFHFYHFLLNIKKTSMCHNAPG